MNNLATLYIKADVLKTLYDTIQKKGSKGVELTISTSDKNNDYNKKMDGSERAHTRHSNIHITDFNN